MSSYRLNKIKWSLFKLITLRLAGLPKGVRVFQEHGCHTFKFVIDVVKSFSLKQISSTHHLVCFGGENCISRSNQHDAKLIINYLEKQSVIFSVDRLY